MVMDSRISYLLLRLVNRIARCRGVMTDVVKRSFSIMSPTSKRFNAPPAVMQMCAIPGKLESRLLVMHIRNSSVVAGHRFKVK